MLQMVCVLFHGQAHIELGFKTNKDFLKVNLESHSLINLRFVYEHLTANSYEAHNIQL